MDIQKKREAFEKLSEIAEILKNKTIKFVEKTNKYYSYHYSVEYLNGAWMAWQAKAQAVPEWVNYELEKPEDGQKCLVVFESMDAGDSHRWMCIDEFNEGMFDFIANWEDECASVALPAGSVIPKVRAVCWAKTNLSNAPLSFDQFYKTQEPANEL